MSLLLTRIVWYSKEESDTSGGTITYSNPTDITDAIDYSVGKGLDIKNNTLSFNLRNGWAKYINTDGEIKFQEEDQIKVYLKYTNDNDDITSAWDENDSSFPASGNLVGVYYVKEFGGQHSNAGARIKLTCVDKTYILFNRVYSDAISEGSAVNAPELIQKIIRHVTQGSGEYTTGGVNYEIDAKLVSDGGYITDTRSASPTDFPDIAMSKVWKPVYEWIRELSGVDYINTVNEISGQSYVYGRPFIFWVDEDNKFHWVEPDYASPTTIVVGTDTVFNVNLTKKIFGTTNMIIYNTGTDMKGNGIWSYYLDESSNIQGLQMRVVPMTHICRDLINEDYKTSYNPASTRDDGGDGAGYPIPQYIAAYGGGLAKSAFTHSALDTYTTPGTITSDSTYNSALKERALYEGEQLAKKLTAGLAHAKWRGTVEIKGQKIAVGTLITFTDSSIGLNKEELRLMDIKHNVTPNGWFTTLSLEKDPETLIDSLS